VLGLALCLCVDLSAGPWRSPSIVPGPVTNKTRSEHWTPSLQLIILGSGTERSS
jgi:hypothetical protein